MLREDKFMMVILFFTVLSWVYLGLADDANMESDREMLRNINLVRNRACKSEAGSIYKASDF